MKRTVIVGLVVATSVIGGSGSAHAQGEPGPTAVQIATAFIRIQVEKHERSQFAELGIPEEDVEQKLGLPLDVAVELKVTMTLRQFPEILTISEEEARRLREGDFNEEESLAFIEGAIESLSALPGADRLVSTAMHKMELGHLKGWELEFSRRLLKGLVRQYGDALDSVPESRRKRRR